MIVKTEKILLMTLNFKTNLPTAFDFAQYFLFLSDETFDFSDMLEDSLSFIYVALLGKFLFPLLLGRLTCVLDHKFSEFSQSAIAIASVLLSLEFKGPEWSGFRDEWLNFVCKILVQLQFDGEGD